ncbi:hypothetical protein NZK35_22325 [Stieleria sp. ICT_E10.1]|uniref:hypothetical protein n=1 Tax=Stieleria sedimenti TaxID=2976331 RepID=UPI00217F230A|nr:hypothetical protein [Stieleria sedimenti]MCS7469398.1 hypothetical protein [Stieleria sedimenti]
MTFTDRMIELAIAMKSAGVPWQPSAGHYVLDQDRVVQRASPFQEHVYFVLNLPHFVKLAGGVDAFVDKMVWLPTWEQSRQVLRDAGMTDQCLQSILLEKNSIARQEELVTLYELILDRFGGASLSADSPNLAV